jgi:arabinose-5-phosphate isomerase
MDYLEKAGRVLDIEIFELSRLRKRLGEDFSRAVELIRETLDARGKVVVVGVGKSGHIGSKIAATLTSRGARFLQCIARRPRHDRGRRRGACVERER